MLRTPPSRAGSPGTSRGRREDTDAAGSPQALPAARRPLCRASSAAPRGADASKVVFLESSRRLICWVDLLCIIRIVKERFFFFLRLTADQKFEVRKKHGTAVRGGGGGGICGPDKVLRPLLHTHDLSLDLTLLSGRHGEPAGSPKNGTTAPRDRPARRPDPRHRHRPNPAQGQLGIVLSVSTVRRGLWRLRLTPQRPKRRTTKYETADVQRWKDEDFPNTLRRARELGTMIACADESDLAAPSVCGRLGGIRGQTPVGRVASGRFRLHLLAASSPEGQLHGTVQKGPVTAEVFRELLERIAEQADRKILLVVGNCRIHRARIIQEWLEANQAAAELCLQPAYSPQVNPVERLGALVQRRVSRQLSQTEAQLHDNLEAACQSLQKAPEQVRAFFREADCQSILACISMTRLLTRSVSPPGRCGPIGSCLTRIAAVRQGCPRRAPRSAGVGPLGERPGRAPQGRARGRAARSTQGGLAGAQGP